MTRPPLLFLALGLLAACAQPSSRAGDLAHQSANHDTSSCPTCSAQELPDDFRRVDSGAGTKVAAPLAPPPAPVVRSSGWEAITTPQMPTPTYDTFTTAGGTAELELGGVFDGDDAHRVPALMKVGLSDYFEIDLGWDAYKQVPALTPDARGPGDLSLGVRHRFLEESAGLPALAYNAGVKFPTAADSKGLGTGEADYMLGIAANKDMLGATWGAFYQAAVLGQPAGGKDKFDAEHRAALDVSTELAPHLSGFVQFGDRWVQEQRINQAYGMSGVYFDVAPNLTVHLAGLAGLNPDAPDFQIMLGLAWNFGKFFDPLF
ncbi:MAG TPA: hypothetical protein VGC54_10475 [Planctomycetota bacterium]